MNLSQVGKPVVLTTVGVSTMFATTTLLNKGLAKVAPNAFEYTEGMDRKETALWVAKTIGATVAITIIAGAVAHQAQSMVEAAFWPTSEDSE